MDAESRDKDNDNPDAKLDQPISKAYAQPPIPPENSLYKPKIDRIHYSVSWGTILILVLLISVIAFLDSYAYNEDVYNASVYKERHQLLNDVVGSGDTQHLISVGGSVFYINFDKNAAVVQPTKTISYVSLIGQGLSGGKVTVEVSASSEPPSSDPCSDLYSSSTVLGSVIILGKTYPVCGQNSTSSTVQNQSIGTQFKINEQWYSMVFVSATKTAVDTDSAKTIAQSVIL